MTADPRWNRLSNLFDQALELPEEARANWLESACADDPALRAEVFAMLKAHQLRQGILESDVITDTRAVLQETVSEALADRYDVERLLGEGGMASVFLAHEKKHGRRVVIKVLKPQIAARYGVDRFLREVRIAARLAHPHILGLIDSGEARGLLYYVMPYVEGETLRQRLDRAGPLPIRDALSLLRDLADALAHAHRAGVVHRDLKPGNVLWVGNHAFLMDFGIAKLVDEQDSMELTDHGFAVGTPAYMPPEQRVSDPSLDHRADLYAWGTLAHETLTGRLPLPPEKAGEVDTGGVRAHRLELPESVARLVARCLATEPSRRPANAEEIVAALDALGAPTTSATPRRSFSRLALLAIVVVVSLGSFAVWRATRPPPPSAGSLPTPITVLGFTNETGDPSLDPWGRMAGDWLTQGLQATGLVPVVPWPTALQASQLLQTQREAGRGVNPVSFLREETGAGTVVTGSYYLLGDSLQFRLEVADAVRGRVLGTIAPIMTSRAAPQAGIEAMRDRLMGMIALWTEDQITHAHQLEQRPPTFEAYQIFEGGAERFRNQDYAGAMTEYRRAFLADTEFVGALLSAGIASWNLGDAKLTDSIVREIHLRESKLGDYQRLRLESLDALLAGDGEAEVIALRKASAEAPGSMATYNLAVASLSTDRPQEALAALETLGPERGDMRGWSSYWTQLTHALHLVGDHERELKAARELRSRYPDRRVGLTLEVRALAAEGRAAAIDSVLFAARALPPAAYWSQGAAMVVAGEELATHGWTEAGTQYLLRGKSWLEGQLRVQPGDESHLYWLGSALYDLGEWAPSRRIFDSLSVQDPDRLQYRGLAALARARTGSVPDTLGRVSPAERGEYTMFRARLAAISGDYTGALALFGEASRLGLRGLPWIHSSAYRDLVAYRDDRRALPVSLRPAQASAAKPN